jgi:hypothetical protein
MERREHYDPEDIENLLQEREFDELLEEERAYVLRHLSSREEYEHMRSLLLHMRQTGHSGTSIEAGPEVREAVMQAFRAQQNPQWRIWLNSIGTVLMPQEGTLWRPAFALGMVLLLVGIGVYLVQEPITGTGTQELAEVRQRKAEETPVPHTTEPALDSVIPPGTDVADVTRVPQAEVQEQQWSATSEPTVPAAPSTGLREMETADDGMDLEAPLEVARAEDAVSSPVPSLSHVVTSEEMTRNMSMANATGKVAQAEVKKEQRARADAGYGFPAAPVSRPLAQDARMLDLLSAGW